MDSSVFRFYVDPDLGELRGLQLAIPRLAAVAREDDSNQVTVYSYSKDNLDGSELQKYFGYETIRPWQRSGASSIVQFQGLSLPRIGSNAIDRNTIHGAVLVLYPTPEMLEKLDRQQHVTAVGLVGWCNLDDAAEWIAKWSAERVTEA